MNVVLTCALNAQPSTSPHETMFCTYQHFIRLIQSVFMFPVCIMSDTMSLDIRYIVRFTDGLTYRYTAVLVVFLGNYIPGQLGFNG